MRGTAFSYRAITCLSLLTTTVGAYSFVVPAIATEVNPSPIADSQRSRLASQASEPDFGLLTSNFMLTSTASEPFDPENITTAIAGTSAAAVTGESLNANPQAKITAETSTPPVALPVLSQAADTEEIAAPISELEATSTTQQVIELKPIATPQPQPIQLRSPDVRLEFLPAGDPRVAADGRSTVTLQGQLLNAEGEVLPIDAIATLTASAGQFIGADQDPDQPGFQVQVYQGQFTAELQSTLEAQKVRVRAAIALDEETDTSDQERSDAADSNQSGASDPATDSRTAQLTDGSELETYTQVEFITNLRPSLVTGSINLRIGQAGTDFYSSFRDFLDPELLDEGTTVDADAAVFAIGAIGDWLFTGAYNSDRPLNETCDGTTRLFRDVQFCDQTYPVYGDSSTSEYLTPSIDSVYLRFERTSLVPGAEPDYGMWGDYNTQEFSRSSQLYTATTRQLHGFKGNYNLGDLQATLMYGNNIQGFQRDTIAPDGTSGYYFLSRRLVVPGSEIVAIELEELNRPGTVLERKILNRGLDYEIDYDRGSILFRRPLLGIELDPFGNTLVRRIVATYQNESTGGDADLYAGRLQYNFSQEFDRESWAAVSYLREDQGARDYELYGLDFLFPIGNEGQLVGEVARSSNDSIFLGNTTGSAYRLELTTKLSSAIAAQAYYRSVDEGFANNATFSFVPGQTRYGAAIAAALSETTKLNAQYDRETNYGIAPLVRTTFVDLFNPTTEPIPGSAVDNTLTTVRAGVQQKLGKADLSVEWVNRDREDRATPELFEGNTSQLVSRFAMPLTEDLTFKAQNELNLGDSDPLYPDRTTFGVDWSVYPGVTVRLAHQFSSGGLLGDTSITSLDTILEHNLSKNTSVTGRYSLLSGYNGMTGQGAIGLNHRWAIAPGLRMNLSYEHIFNNLFVQTAAGQQFPQPYAVGQSAAALGLLSGDSYGVGLEYTDNPNFQASARFEHRTSSAGSNTVISAAAAGKLSPALTALARYQQASASNQLLSILGDTSNLKVGLAYRDPRDDRFNALLRYEYRQNPATSPDTLLFGRVSDDTTDHLFALEAIYAPNWRWEFYGKYALRNSTSYSAADLSSTNSISLAQVRTAYRLGYRTDLVGELRWITQPTTDFSELGWVVETGYYLTPNLRLAAGYSSGNVNDRDFNGDRSRGGFYLGLNLKLNELFDGFGLQKVAPPQQQESQLEPTASAPNTRLTPLSVLP